MTNADRKILMQEEFYEMKTVDAKGLLCPKPVMMVRDAIQDGTGELSVLVDNEISASNVTRFLENAGYAVARSEGEGGFILRASGAEGMRRERTPGKNPNEEIEPPGDRAYLILSRYIGEEDQELGELLMKSFMGTVASNKPLPRTVALMNGGVKLALADSSCSDTLRELEAAGVAILVCGTCAKHYGILDRIVTGQISNMFEITESVFNVSKPIVLG